MAFFTDPGAEAPAKITTFIFNLFPPRVYLCSPTFVEDILLPVPEDIQVVLFQDTECIPDLICSFTVFVKIIYFF